MQKIEIVIKRQTVVSKGRKGTEKFVFCVLIYPTLNILFDRTVAIVENDWFQMLVAEIGCAATSMTANSGGWTSCRSLTIIIAPNRTTRRKELWLIKASELFKKLLVTERYNWTILKSWRFSIMKWLLVESWILRMTNKL